MNPKIVNENFQDMYQEISDLVALGELNLALTLTDALYNQTIKNNKTETYIIDIFYIAGLYIDIGHLQRSNASSQIGLDILQKNEKEIINILGEADYFYFLGNAKSNLLKSISPFNTTFLTIEDNIQVKSAYWKATIAFNKKNPGKTNPQYLINLGNSLKSQFRLTEALQYYDQVISLNLDIPEAWINRSETLKVLNIISNTYSLQMLEQIKHGYSQALLSKNIHAQLIANLEKDVSLLEQKISSIYKSKNLTTDPLDHETTLKEFQSLSRYRQFCLQNHLSLSEHGLYCSCEGSARDNLTIPTNDGISGDFIIPMEMILNRLKSEFSFARHLLFDFLSKPESDELLHESCFSELFTDEVLGVDVEKLRTAFRLCFGILDKISIAICELLDIYPKDNNNIYFQNFWKLDQDNRRSKFDQFKNYNLLALYSIATDLNNHKNGEWSFLKDIRNKMEHQFVIVHKHDEPSKIYDSYNFIKDIVFIKEDIFISNLKQILQLTRASIFSFVFLVREKAINEHDTNQLYVSNTIPKQDYK